jgi:hypothetical protein
MRWTQSSTVTSTEAGAVYTTPSNFAEVEISILLGTEHLKSALPASPSASHPSRLSARPHRAAAEQGRLETTSLGNLSHVSFHLNNLINSFSDDLKVDLDCDISAANSECVRKQIPQCVKIERISPPGLNRPSVISVLALGRTSMIFARCHFYDRSESDSWIPGYIAHTRAP